MRYVALATDYDATLAWQGRVSDVTRDALRRLRDSGRRAILVTGRELDDLLDVFPEPDLFDRIVAENGALLYRPSTRERKALGEAPPQALVDELRARGVPVSVGASLIATVEPHEMTVMRTIRDLGIEHQVIFNKGSVMILPPGVNKGTGLRAALDELGLSPHNAVGVGDAENDHAFLSVCECAVAVFDALPTLKDRADYVTTGGEGIGVVELVDMLIADDLRDLAPRLKRQDIVLGTADDGQEVRLTSYGASVLVSGPSGSGKSTTILGILERLVERDYQFCLVDPEGDHGEFEAAATLGSTAGAPTPDEVLQVLQNPTQSVVISLTGVSLEDRPAFLTGLLPRLQELRAGTGRPHWIIIDEAHHVLPAVRGAAPQTVPQQLDSLALITLEPHRVARAALRPVDVVVAVGERPWETFADFAAVVGYEAPAMPSEPAEPGTVWAWEPRSGEAPIRVRLPETRTELLRHRRKYAEGDVGEGRSFYFRGPEGKLNLRAQNLMLFLQMADGVDDDTWTFHLRNGDYSRWFGEMLKDPELAEEAARYEQDSTLSPGDSRKRIAEAILDRYTAPA